MTVLTTAAVAALLLFVTGWGSAAASSLFSVFVTNTSSNPVPVQAVGTVPVHEQGTADVNVTNTTAMPVADTNTDANGNIKVHEQRTANVNVTNSSLHVTVGGDTSVVFAKTGVSLGAVEDVSGGPLFVSSYSMIRVQVFNYCASTSPLFFGLFFDGGTLEPDGANITVAPCHTATRVYDIPGSDVVLDAGSTNGSGATANFYVFGREG